MKYHFNARRATVAILCLFLTYLPGMGYAQTPEAITAGTKTGDTTGVISATTTQIQQLVFPLVAPLNGGYTISGQLTLKAGKINYLIFEAAHSNSDTLIVALELITINNIFYIDTTYGNGMHFCKKAGSCASCLFVYNRLDKIIGCSCAQIPQTTDWECKHEFKKVKNN